MLAAFALVAAPWICVSAYVAGEAEVALREGISFRQAVARRVRLLRGEVR